MRTILFVFTFIFIGQALATKPIKMNSIGIGHQLFINASIELPKVHQLNKKAPSNMKIYEKQDSEWALTETVQLNDFFSLTEMIRFQKPIKLKSSKSEIKVAMSLYHCPSNHKGLCVIDDFEGVIKRDIKTVSSEVNITLQGTDPKTL